MPTGTRRPRGKICWRYLVHPRLEAGRRRAKDLVAWFIDGSVRYYKIKYPNGTVDVFRGWCSSLGKAIPAKEVITRTAKITNTGKPELAKKAGPEYPRDRRYAR
jgi:uncharacterized protein YjdB